MPQPHLAGDEEQYGRGLAIIGGLCARWGVSSLIVGKTVWAELTLPAAAPAD